MNKSNIIVSTIVSALVAIVFLLAGHTSAPTSLGGRIETVLNTFGNGIQVSGRATPTSGTIVSQIIVGTGSIIGNTSVTASTTKAFDIAVPGVRSGDKCFAMAASTTQSYIGFQIVGCSASTTPNFITLLVDNPGAAAVVPYPIASATQYFVIR